MHNCRHWSLITNMAPMKVQQNGFTLIELVMVIVLTAIIGTLGARILTSGFSSYATGKDLLEIEWQGNLALERLGRDLRIIRSATNADLTISPGNRINFIDINGDTISYVLLGTTLQRNGETLADDISSLSFTYLRSDGKTTATNTNQVHYIVVSLTSTSGDLSKNIRTVIHPRNFQ